MLAHFGFPLLGEVAGAQHKRRFGAEHVLQREREERESQDFSV